MLYKSGINETKDRLLWTIFEYQLTIIYRSYELTRKDRLYQNIERLQHSKGTKHFNFVPKTFMIPTEYSEFAATHHRMRGAWYD